MNSNWSKKWKKCLIWFSSYISFIAFAIVGGYVIIKNDDEELKKTTKLAFIVTLIFAAINAFVSIYYNFLSMGDSYVLSGAYDFYNIFYKLVNIAEIVVYAVFIIIELAKKDNHQTTKELTNPESE